MELFNELTSQAMDSLSQGNNAALIALFFIAAFTEVGVPFPFIIDSALVLTSFRTGLLSVQLVFMMLALFLGRVAGGAAIYWLSYFVGNAFIKWLSKRFKKLPDKLQWLTNKLTYHAPIAVAIARLTPGLLTSVSVASGCMCLPFFHFILGIAISSVIADGALIIFGVLSGRGVEYLGLSNSDWLVVVALLIAIILIWFAGRFLFKRFSNAGNTENHEK